VIWWDSQQAPGKIRAFRESPRVADGSWNGRHYAKWGKGDFKIIYPLAMPRWQTVPTGHVRISALGNAPVWDADSDAAEVLLYWAKSASCERAPAPMGSVPGLYRHSGAGREGELSQNAPRSAFGDFDGSSPK